MGLKPCRECGREVSTDAKRCPHCGKPNPVQETSKAALGCLTVLGVVVVVGVIASLLPTPRPAPPTPAMVAQSVQAKQQERARQISADSLLRKTSPAAVKSLADGELGLMLNWADPSVNRGTLAAVRSEVARRRARAVQERQRQRLDQLRRKAADYRFSDGSRCTRGTSARIERVLRSHPEWSENDMLGVVCGGIWIGMTSEQLRASRGNPQKINRTVHALGTNEQWVYGDFGPYVYVENGVVTSWQD